MSSAATLTAITALAAELCDPHQHVEPIVDRDPADRRHRRRRVWVTVQPGLILQLRQAAESHVGGRTERDGTSVPDSRPPGGWEALARLNEISTAVNEWCRSLNLPIQDTQDTPEGGIRALAAAAPHLDDTTARHLLTAMRHWRHQAATLTGWATPTYTPAVACPIPDCGRHSTIHIHLDRLTARCTACGAQWTDDGSIRTLANYIAATTSGSTNRRTRIRSGRQGHGGWLHAC